MRRVAWVRVGALGDLLVGLASLIEVMDRWPNAKVTVVGSPLWSQILEPGFFPQIDRIVTVTRKADRKPDRTPDRKAPEGQVFEIVDGRWTVTAQTSLFGAYRFCDVVFNTRVDSPRQALPAVLAGVPERWGAAKGLASLVYNHRGCHYGKDPMIHERDVPLLLMDQAERKDGCVADSLATALAGSPRVKKWKARGLPAPLRFLPSRAKDIVGRDVGEYILVNPTSSRREKAWPSRKFRDAISSFEKMPSEQTGPVRSVFVLGSPDETEWLQEVAANPSAIVQPKSIADLFQVVAGASWLLTNTSSVQFVAAAMRTPVLTLMGRASPEIWGPIGPCDRFVRGVEPTDESDLFERERRAYDSIAVDTVGAAMRAMNASARIVQWGVEKW